MSRAAKWERTAAAAALYWRRGAQNTMRTFQMNLQIHNLQFWIGNTKLQIQSTHNACFSGFANTQFAKLNWKYIICEYKNPKKFRNLSSRFYPLWKQKKLSHLSFQRASLIRASNEFDKSTNPNLEPLVISNALYSKHYTWEKDICWKLSDKKQLSLNYFKFAQPILHECIWDGSKRMKPKMVISCTYTRTWLFQIFTFSFAINVTLAYLDIE